MVRKKLSLILAIALLLTAASSFAFAETQERGKLTYGSTVDMDTDKEWYPTEFILYLQDMINADIEFIEYDNDTLQLALASGDMPDLMMVNTASTILDGGLAVPLDDYLEEYGQNILKYEQRNAVLREFVSNGDGKLYFHTPNTGAEDMTGSTTTWNGYLVRWDLYKEIGAPAINSDDEYIEVLKQMIEIAPTPANGGPVYAMGLHGTDQWAWNIRSMANLGYSNTTTWAYAVNTQTTELVENYTNPDSPFWANMEFYFKLNREGLLDPDSFTMTGDQVQEKAANNQYVGSYCTWYTSDMYDTNRESDPNTLAGIIAVYGEGMSGWYGSNHTVGWGDKLTFITTSCENIPLAVQFLDALDSDELNRVHYSGIEGQTWNYVDGVPTLTDEVVALKAEGGDEWSHLGISSFSNTIGASGFGMHEDGYYYSLWDDPELKYAGLSPLEKDYADFYGVQYPSQVHYNMVLEGTAINQSGNQTQAVQLGMAVRPNEIQRIDARLEEIVNRTIPSLVTAADQAAFDAAKEALINELKGAGADESWEWWNENWNGTLAHLNEMFAE